VAAVRQCSLQGLLCSRVEGDDDIMGLFRRSKQAVSTSHKPTLRERRAAERTAKAEQSLVQTEQKIHQIADEARADLKRP
jgi:hypothetical protein